MNRARLIVAPLAALIIAIVLFFVLRRPDALPPPTRTSTPLTTLRQSAEVPLAATSKLARLRTEIPADAISPIAADLNAPAGSIHHDLELLHAVFEAWQTNFPGDGNPVGENAEITLSLAGDNRLRYAFVAPTHPAINTAGELCDRWGTPFRFHQLSGTLMEIRSAGADRRFGTDDDVQFAPGRNTP